MSGIQVDGVKVVHFIPGRVRLKVKEMKGEVEFSQQVEAELSTVPGIEQVEVNPITGSVLIKYDTAAVDCDASIDALAATLRHLFPSLDVDRMRSWVDRVRK